MLCTGDMYLSSLFVCRHSSCQTAPPGVRDALGYVQVLFQFCTGQDHLDSVPGAVEDPGMIYLIHHGVMRIPLVRLLPITFHVRCFAHLYLPPFSSPWIPPIPYFIWICTVILSILLLYFHFFSFLIHFSYVLVTMLLLKAFCTSLEGVFSPLISLSTANAAVGKGTYKLCCVQCIIILVLHDSSCLWVRD